MYKRCSYFKAIINKQSHLPLEIPLKETVKILFLMHADTKSKTFGFCVQDTSMMQLCVYIMLLLAGNVSVETYKIRWRGNWKRPFWLIRQLFFRKSMTTRLELFVNLAVPLAKVSWLSYELWEMCHLYIAFSTFSLTGNTLTDILVIWKNRTLCNLDLL